MVSSIIVNKYFSRYPKQLMNHENRTETEHKVLDMSLGKYLKMLKKNFKL